MIFPCTPISRGRLSREVPARLLFRLSFFAALAVIVSPSVFAQYQTYPIYTNVSSVPAGSYGTTIVASVNDGSTTANFNVCFDTGYGSSKVPIAPYNYVNYGDFAQFNFDVPPSTIQAVPPSAFASGSFAVSIYSVPKSFSACNGNEGGAPQGNTVTLNYPVLNSVSLPDLPEQNTSLSGREPSSIALTGSNFISNSGTTGAVPSAVNFTSSTTVAGTVKFLNGYSLRSTIPTTIPAAASSVNIEVCNTATYSYCSNSLTLKTVALDADPGTITATPSPAFTTQPVTLTATFGPATHSTAGAPSGPVTFADWGNTLGTAKLVLDKTASFAQAPTQQFLVYDLPIPPIVADFNGDGIPDTLFIDPGTINNNATLHLQLGTIPSGSFQADEQFYLQSDGPYFMISSAAVADVNGDGIPDIILLGAQNYYSAFGSLTLYTMLGNGDGTFQDGFSSSPTLYGSQIVAGDFNKDGKQDIVIAGALDANGTIGLQTFLGDGTGNFTAGPATTGLRTAPNSDFGDFKVAAADFNGDGYPDIAVMNGSSPQTGVDNSIEVYQNSGKAAFAAPVKVQTDGTNKAGFSIAALGPGLPLDIIVTSTASSTPGVYVALNQSTTAKIAFFGTFQLTPVSGLTQAVFGDFDGDGLLDVAVDDAKTIHVLSGNGLGAFTATYTDLSIVPPGTTLIAGSDENGDSYADLLLYTTGAQNGNTEYPITLYDYITSGTATATFPPVTFAAGTHPLHALTAGTFNILPGVATANLIVTAPAASTVTLTATPVSPANYGTATVTLTATIPVSDATGTVSFYNGTTLLGTEPLVDETNSTATYILSAPAAATYSFKAVYGGDQTHGAGISAPLPYVVNPVAATIAWTPSPATIVYGTALSAAQLDATATGITGAPVAGSFSYAPALGTVLTAGTHSVVATFTPTDTNYATSTATRTITVTQAEPVVTWVPNPATITYGTALSAAQLDATSSTPGAFAYNPALGAVLTAGTQTLSAVFTPTDSVDFASVTKTVTITVDPSGLKLSTTSVQFGNQPYGTTSAAQIVTITNPGTETIHLDTSAGDYTGPDPADFTSSSTCPAGLLPGASCQISFTFTPDGVGPKTGVFGISDDSNPSVQNIGLSGTGTGGVLQVNPGNLKTIAGDGTQGYTGDNGPAIAAELNEPAGIAFDSGGNLYIADDANNVVRKVDTSGKITTVAGTGTAGYTGDNGQATSAELSSPDGVALDKAGNLYIEDFGNSVIRKVDTSGIITTFAGTGAIGHSGDGGPATQATFYGLGNARFDSAGNLFVPDCDGESVRRIDTKGIITTVAGNFTAGYSGDGGAATSAQLHCPAGVAIDPQGNLYIADVYNYAIRKVDTQGIISTIAGNGTAGATGDGGPATAATLKGPADVVLDAAGDLYIADIGNNRIRKIDTQGIITTVAGGLNNAGSAGVNSPGAVTVDASGNLYFSDTNNNAVRELYPQGTTPFPATVLGTAATPQTVTLSNIGNVPIVIPASGAFTLSGNASDFSLSGGTCLNGATLAVNESTCTLQISFTPTAAGTRTLTVSIADDALNSPQSFTIGGIGSAATPTLTWTPPAAITYGTPLSAAQLDAAATGLAGAAVSGTYTYSPAAGTVLTAGTHTLSVVFASSDPNYSGASASVAITVTQAAPSITWLPNPATIAYGTALSAAQLDATSATPGTFTYTPALGTVLGVGTQTLSAVFTPKDATDFKSVTTTTTIVVTPAAPVITWTPNPATITYGTMLTAAQLDASSSTPGNFTYTPGIGTILTAGAQTLSAVFTPADTADFKTVTVTANIVVTAATPAITWAPNPATIAYGTGLSAAQLDATSTTPGTFAYTPALGTILTAGTQTLSVLFTPTDSVDFKAVTATATIAVTAVTPTVSWTPNPATIAYGTALSAAQLDATSTTPGSFAYTPALGTVLAAGTQTLTSVFTPTDTTDFKSVTSKATIVVAPVAPAITWTPNPATIAYGTPLSAAQLDATASTPGTFTYTPALGTILPAGTQTLKVAFTPADATDFTAASATATITVTAATPTVTWTPNPATITYGTALTAAQLDANASTPGTFTYSPALGTILTAGTQTLSATFTPNDTTDFKSVTVTASITVTAATPAVTWTPSPATIAYGTALSAAQLDATSSTPGTFTYTPAAGTILTAGTQTLSVLFTPTDAKDFKSLSATATITVTVATPAVTWTPNPATITYGTALSAAQLDATSSTSGTFSYNPGPGTVLSAGSQTLSVFFTPADTKDFKSLTATATITVAQAAPTITWATPASIVAGTALSSTQLDATATGVTGAALPGTFTYTPSAGTVPAAGTQTLKVTFTPSDLADYTTASASVSLQVIPLTLTALSTSTANLGDPAKTITLTGTGFIPSASVLVNGSAIPTTFVNATTLTAVIPAADFLTAQTLEISVAEPSLSQTTAALPLLVGAPPADALFSGPATISPGTQTSLTFQLAHPYPVDLTATFQLSFVPAAGLPNDPTIVFASGGTTFVAVIPANTTAAPSVQVQGGTVAGTVTVNLTLEAGGVNVTPASIEPLVIQAPLAAPGITSVTLTPNGNTLTVAVRGFSNPRDMSMAKFHFTPVSGGSIGTPDVTIDVGSLFTTWYADPASSQYGSSFTYTQVFNLSSDASVVGQVSVSLANSVGVSQEASTP